MFLGTATLAARAEEHDDLGVRECVLRTGLSEDARSNETCYISFGATMDSNTRERTYTDPPDEFLSRFKGDGFTVKKVSEKPRVRGGARLDFTTNPLSGCPDGLYTVNILSGAMMARRASDMECIEDQTGPGDTKCSWSKKAISGK